MPSNIPTSQSTTSLANTISSTTPLNPPQTPQKDYAAAFGYLQTKYGTHTPFATPVSQKQTNSAPSQSTSLTSGGGKAGVSNSNSGGAPKPSPSAASADSQGSNSKRSFLPWKKH